MCMSTLRQDKEPVVMAKMSDKMFKVLLRDYLTVVVVLALNSLFSVPKVT